jgi:putative oxidoreductase
MNLTLNSLEKQRDFGLLVLRIVIGGTYVFYGWQKLAAGPKAWESVGAAVHLFGADGGYLYWGMAATFAELVGGALLVLGFLVRPAALALFGTMVVATVVKWQSVRWGAMESISGFFYPLSLAAVAFALVFVGGGKYGLDGGGSNGASRAAAGGKEK